MEERYQDLKKNLARDMTFKVKFNDQWRGDKLLDILTKLHEMFDDLLSEARGHDADLGRVVLSHPSLTIRSLYPSDRCTPPVLGKSECRCCHVRNYRGTQFE